MQLRANQSYSISNQQFDHLIQESNDANGEKSSDESESSLRGAKNQGDLDTAPDKAWC